MKKTKWNLHITNYSDFKTGKVSENLTISCPTRAAMREIGRAIKYLNSAGMTIKQAPASGIVCVAKTN